MAKCYGATLTHRQNSHPPVVLKDGRLAARVAGRFVAGRFTGPMVTGSLNPNSFRDQQVPKH